MLFAGPYDNEFGHELFSFQGHIRYLSKRFNKVTVCTKPEMFFLYKDFASDFIPLGTDINKDLYPNALFINDIKILPNQIGIKEKQIFIKYGKKIDKKFDLIIHARSKKEGMGDFNLAEDTYSILNKELKNKYNIAFIGKKEYSYCPMGAEDLRGIRLEDLANVLCSSRLIVGPSSGPIHFASLCGAPHVTWGGFRLRTFYRYSHFWNPFNTPCYIFEREGLLLNLKKRAKIYNAPSDVLERSNVNVVYTERFNQPKLKDLIGLVEKILNV